MNNKQEIKWLDKPEAHDYNASFDYLSLLYKVSLAKKITELLKLETVTKYKAKDIFRASELSLLGISNSHVEKVKFKIENNISISPILLYVDPKHNKLIITDGYHRMCAVYGYNEDAYIHCKIVY